MVHRSPAHFVHRHGLCEALGARGCPLPPIMWAWVPSSVTWWSGSSCPLHGRHVRARKNQSPDREGGWELLAVVGERQMVDAHRRECCARWRVHAHPLPGQHSHPGLRPRPLGRRHSYSSLNAATPAEPARNPLGTEPPRGYREPAGLPPLASIVLGVNTLGLGPFSQGGQRGDWNPGAQRMENGMFPSSQYTLPSLSTCARRPIVASTAGQPVPGHVKVPPSTFSAFASISGMGVGMWVRGLMLPGSGFLSLHGLQLDQRL